MSMRENCGGCKEHMPYQSQERYETVGNFCEKCIAVVNKRLKSTYNKQKTPTPEKNT